MASYNNAILAGYLGKDPETKYPGEDKQVTQFSLATSKKWKGNNDVEQERTEWHTIVCWGKLAEIAAKYLKKGALVLIEGEIKYEKYESDGITKYATKINANRMVMLDKGEKKQDGAAVKPGTEKTPEQKAAEDDLPF